LEIVGSGTKQSRQGEEGPKKRNVLTVFQQYRNSRLNLDYQTEITERTLAECFDESLRQVNFLFVNGKVIAWRETVTGYGQICS